jgi:hypothetical protein
MGFFTDVGNFAKGMIERDREITNENLAIRAEELKANRDLMIAMKKDKYAADIAEYKKEKAKSNEIKQLNSAAASGNMDNESYAKQFLLHSLGTEKFNALQKADPAGFLDMVSNVANQAKANGGLDYRFTIDRNSLDNQFGTDTKIINKGFAQAIEDAKGDSFLINKILNKKSTVDKDVNADVESQLKAAKVVNEETIETGKKDITFTDTVKKKRKPPEAYETEFSKLITNAKFDSVNNKDNLINFINASNNLGFTSEMNFKFDEKDETIKGTNPASQAFLNSYKLIYSEILNANNATDLYNSVTKNKSDLVNLIDADAVNRKVQNVILTRQNKIDTGKGSWEDNRELITMLPLNVVDINNQTRIGDKMINIDMAKSSEVYNNFLKKKADTLYAGSKLDEFQKLSNIQQLIENGNATLINQLKAELVSSQPKSDEVEVTSTNNTVAPDKVANEIEKNKPKSKVILLPDGSGFVRGNKKYTWENIEKSKQENKLTTDEKIEYNKWKENKNNKNKKPIKGTTFEDIQASTDANTQKITEAFTDSEGNFENMKTNKSNIRPFSKG